MNTTAKNLAAALVLASTILNVGQTNAESVNPSLNCKQSLTIEEFKAFALNNSPLISEIDQQYASELKNAFETKVLSNPEIQFEQTYTNEELNGDNDTQSNVSIGQPIRLSNFGSRTKLSSTIKNLGNIDKKIKFLEFTQKINLNFYNLYVLQKTSQILKNSADLANNKLVLIKDGVKKGQLSKGDEKIFEGEKFRLLAETKGIEAELELIQAELTKLLGLKCRISLATQPPIDPIPTERDLIEMAKSNGLSELARNKILTDLVKSQIEVSKLDIVPQFTPKLVYQHTNDGGDFFGFGIALPLPIWNRNQGELMKLDAEQLAISKKTSYLNDGGLELQISTLRLAAVTAAEQFEIFSTKVVPSFEQALASQENLYLKGQGNIVQVWQSLRVLNETQLRALTSLMQAANSRIKLSIIVGEEI